MPDPLPEAQPIGLIDYTLRPGQIHLWKVPLPSAAADPHHTLSAAEHARAARYAFEKDRARFVSCRASLRLLLGRYTGVPPESIAFRYEPQGKPALDGIPGWQFNLSHSRDLAAIAISLNDAIGVDLEFIDPGFPCDQTAPEILTQDELRDLAAIPPGLQPASFFQLWTAKEALLKAAGTGLSMDPRAIHLHLDEALNPTIVSAPPELRDASLHHITLQSGYAAALAVLGRVSDLAIFTL